MYKTDNGEVIFKPLSKTKPWCTLFFSYAEVICSRIVNRYFDDSAPLYSLAICHGITKDVPKYREHGTLVPNLLNDNQKLINLLEYFNQHPDPNFDISDYENFCQRFYDYRPILKSEIFDKTTYGEKLAQQYLLSLLFVNHNFHYENVAFIEEEGNIISLAPPIDHEFAVMVTFTDHLEKQSDFMDSFNSLFKDDSVSPFMVDTIAYICKTYPGMVEKFQTGLSHLHQDLQISHIPDIEHPYIYPFSSFDFGVGRLLYSDQPYDLEPDRIKDWKRYAKLSNDRFYPEKTAINKVLNGIRKNLITNTEALSSKLYQNKKSLGRVKEDIKSN